MSQSSDRTIPASDLSLGVCYYPEHWPENEWARDAREMAALGLRWVRIGEFAWSRLEPSPGNYNFDWLDRAIGVLRDQGLKIVLGTPTATPPRWMIDRFPDMLPVGPDGHNRRFGSRRHYSFSHAGYRDACAVITEQLASRYGQAVQAWQTDNEYGCHDSTCSYGPHDRNAFQNWLSARYGTIDALNAQWGNVFWSMDYDNFEQVDLPNHTVTEANPAHWLDFKRFSSDQVIAFNCVQTDIIRRYSDAPISHNYMGRVMDFDHFKVGADCDFATWDSYPLGFLEDRIPVSEDLKRAYARQGDPDFQAFHHDLYRAVGRGRWWVMEQQPGPVNWAPYNPAPLPGMVRAWSWEAFAHGAETVAYFRWRQAPFAQEQHHAGLLRPDGTKSDVWPEIETMAKDIRGINATTRDSDVAIVFDYTSCWAWDIQPQGQGFSHFDTLMVFYRALRRLGLSVDILPPDTQDFGKRKLILIPALMSWSEPLLDAVKATQARVLVGPRTGSKTDAFQMEGCPIPGMDIHLPAVETLRPGVEIGVAGQGAFELWREHISSDVDDQVMADDGWPAWVTDQNLTYLTGLPTAPLADYLIGKVCNELGLPVEVMPEGVRRRDRGDLSIYINYSQSDQPLRGDVLPPAGVKCVQRSD